MTAQTRNFTNLATAEAWLRWIGFDRYLGLLSWDRSDAPGASKAVAKQDESGAVVVTITEPSE